MELGGLVNIADYGYHVYAGKTDKQYIFYDFDFNRVYFPFNVKKVKYGVKPYKVTNHRHFDIGNKIFCLQANNGKVVFDWVYYIGSNDNFIRILKNDGITDKKVKHSKDVVFFRYDNANIQQDSLRHSEKVFEAVC